jgi:hypothetical protein
VSHSITTTIDIDEYSVSAEATRHYTSKIRNA